MQKRRPPNWMLLLQVLQVALQALGVVAAYLALKQH
jgi:hypothetical protein